MEKYPKGGDRRSHGPHPQKPEPKVAKTNVKKEGYSFNYEDTVKKLDKYYQMGKYF